MIVEICRVKNLLKLSAGDNIVFSVKISCHLPVVRIVIIGFEIKVFVLVIILRRIGLNFKKQSVCFLEHILNTNACSGRHWKQSVAFCFNVFPELYVFLAYFKILRIAAAAENIDFVCDNNLRLLKKSLAVTGKFGDYLIEILPWISSLAAGNIYNVDKNLGSFDMLQEIVSQACPLMGAFNYSGNISHYEA